MHVLQRQAIRLPSEGSHSQCHRTSLPHDRRSKYLQTSIILMAVRTHLLTPEPWTPEGLSESKSCIPRPLTSRWSDRLVQDYARACRSRGTHCIY